MLGDRDLAPRRLFLGGSSFKGMEIPAGIPGRMKPWYTRKDMYVGKDDPPRKWAFSDRVLKETEKDFRVLAPLYQTLRGYIDEQDPKGS